jgi:hypothetical protein
MNQNNGAHLRQFASRLFSNSIGRSGDESYFVFHGKSGFPKQQELHLFLHVKFE